MRRSEKKVEQILKDLDKKMVFLSGPRQVGKTWLSKKIMERFNNVMYLNYDVSADRAVIKAESWPQDIDLLVLDELHKMKMWKNYLKGVFDSKPDGMRILVTGSARLDTFRKSGDSLAGRFFSHRLLPFSLAELVGTEYDGDIERLLKRGGFPEAFLAGSIDDANRWREQYVDGLIRTDITDFKYVQDLRIIEDVFNILRAKVGSPVSYESIARDVGSSPATVKRYVQILEALYIVFLVKPYSNKIARSILKQPKIYFFDNGLVLGDDGAKFENLVANALLKHVYGLHDMTGQKLELAYLRTKDGKEVDFAIVENNGLEKQIVEAIEVKVSDTKVSKNLKYFTQKLNVRKSAQVVLSTKHKELEIDNIKVLRASEYLKSLFM